MLCHTAPLQVLNLNNNLLDYIGKNIRDKMDSVGTVNYAYQYNYMDLSDNKLSCTCKTIDFVHWLSVSKVQFMLFDDYICKDKNGEIKKLKFAAEIVLKLDKECANYITLIICLSIGFVVCLVVIIHGIMYRYRWDLRYFYYSFKLKMKGSNHLLQHEGDTNDYEYDAFVSYANENGNFVKNDLVPELEDKRCLRLLVHDRDFRAGEFVCDNIMSAITTSKKTLIIMSKHFLKSDWCIFEMNMARMETIKTGRNVLCVIMLEEVPSKGLPLEILDIVRQQTYMEVPLNDEHMDLFWDRVHAAMIE
jgi:hypothetical protein